MYLAQAGLAVWYNISKIKVFSVINTSYSLMCKNNSHLIVLNNINTFVICYIAKRFWTYVVY